MSGRRRPRIVHVINSLNVGGAETQLARIVGAAHPTPFEHVVLPLLAGGGVSERVRTAGALAPPLRVDGLASLATAPVRLAHRLRRLQPDLVHGWLLQGNIAATLGSALGHLGVPVLWNVRWALYDLDSEPKRTRALLRLSSTLSRRPMFTVYNSRVAVPQHVAIGFPADRARVIPNGFDLSRFRPDPEARAMVRSELGISEAATVVGLVGRYHPMKDHAMSLHAAAHLVERGWDAIFVYAGSELDSSNESLTTLVQELGLVDRVRLIGERDDVARLYPALDIFWMSSWARGIAEGFPNVVAEAMACGVPCVVTDVGDAAWIVGDTGAAVPPRDARALSDATATLLAGGPDELRRRGIEARARIERDFSLDSVSRQYVALYEHALGLAPADIRSDSPG